MMPKLEYFVVCESISIDQATNRVSLFNIVEDLHPARTDAPGDIIAQFVAVSCWNREPGDEGRDFQSILRIHTSSEDTSDFPMNFRMERPRQRLVLRIQGIPPLRGESLKFELILNGQHIADHIVTVHPAAIPEAAHREPSTTQ